ncbi:DUF3157 family protein [Chryseobacterium sp.]|uniref:DUF3157 family protein n=1 Tax=Chryseobacterium sp. TaxID=1871047 RepID=UPI0028993EF2|nr:DUF3157 family protein [Chryseobacterium sp.]
MKKLVTILALLALCKISAQEVVKTLDGKSIKLNSDKTWEYVDSKINTQDEKLSKEDLKEVGEYISTNILDLPIKNFKDGEDKLTKVKVKFNAPLVKFNETNLDNINSIYKMSIEWTKMKLKNPYSFSPKEIDLSYSEKYDIWWCTVKYVAKNSYGGEVAGSSFFTYPMGNVSKPYTDDELLELTKKNKKKR